jgi:uncharacterized protein YndB with AHSA1/START domain
MPAHTPSPDAPRVTVTRDFPFPPEQVYDAWLDADAVGRWLFATPGGVMQRAELDPRVGGRFAIDELRGDVVAVHFGEFLELDRPRRIVFSFGCDPNAPLTRVSVALTATPQGCRVVLTHDMDPQWAVMAPRVTQGWTMMLDGLAGTMTADREIVSWRVFPVPCEQVFAAFRDSARLAKWWGPAGFTNTIQEFDPRPGGTWKITMRGPDGVEYPNESVFREVVPPQRVVYDHLEPAHQFRMTMSLIDNGDRTTLLWRMVFESAEECTRLRQFIEPANEQNFDRLAAVLAADGAA